MAKTRMKTTPTRLQKDTLTAVNIKNGLRHVSSVKAKEPLHINSTIVAPTSKRASSISSATSSISHNSDAHSLHSDNEYGPTVPLDVTKVITTTSTTLTGIIPQSPLQVNSVKSSTNSNGKTISTGALKNRKIFLITEKCDGVKTASDDTGNCASVTGQKRKMYLIMEEQTHQQQKDPQNPIGSQCDQEELIRNESAGSATKKLTLFTDKCDAQKFEKILPEILSRINNKVKDEATKVIASPSATAVIKQNGTKSITSHTTLEMQLPLVKLQANSNAEKVTETTDENKRLPITLPPKKNRLKIINTTATTSPTTVTSISGQRSVSAAIPVIVSNSNLMTVAALASTTPTAKKPIANTCSTQKLPQKNINLSTDFLFLMKMLPQLERIPEPQKSHVKSCIEEIVTQNSLLLSDLQTPQKI